MQVYSRPIQFVILLAGLGSFAERRATASDPDTAMASPRILSGPISGCDAHSEDGAIIVCGSRSGTDSPYRLPEELRRQNRAQPSYQSSRLSGALADPAASADCGIFQGQRRCGKSEMRSYGYGGGRDPVTVVVKVIEKLSDR